MGYIQPLFRHRRVTVSVDQSAGFISFFEKKCKHWKKMSHNDQHEFPSFSNPQLKLFVSATFEYSVYEYDMFIRQQKEGGGGAQRFFFFCVIPPPPPPSPRGVSRVTEGPRLPNRIRVAFGWRQAARSTRMATVPSVPAAEPYSRKIVSMVIHHHHTTQQSTFNICVCTTSSQSLRYDKTSLEKEKKKSVCLDWTLASLTPLGRPRHGMVRYYSVWVWHHMMQYLCSQRAEGANCCHLPVSVSVSVFVLTNIEIDKGLHVCLV